MLLRKWKKEEEEEEEDEGKKKNIDPKKLKQVALGTEKQPN